MGLAVPPGIRVNANFAWGPTSPFGDSRLLIPNLAADSKILAIKELVDRLHASGFLDDSLRFLQSVLEREALGSTIISDVAIPHARCSSVSHMGVALGVLPTPIDYPSGDDRSLVQLVCLIAVPTDSSEMYLSLLASLARSLSDARLKSALLDCTSSAQLKSTLSSYSTPQPNEE